jgi:hypothetical protein
MKQEIPVEIPIVVCEEKWEDFEETPRSPSPEIARPKTFGSEVSSPERSHANLNGHEDQYILDSIDITGECPQQDF